MWSFLRNNTNRAVLSWLGAGVVALVSGAWAVYTYLPVKDGVVEIDCTIEANLSAAACRDIQARDIAIGNTEGRSKPEE